MSGPVADWGAFTLSPGATRDRIFSLESAPPAAGLLMPDKVRRPEVWLDIWRFLDRS
ncbi:hypothetical protein SBA1_630036 [Candidatus Sulfotelmatobacter kueseliae]|uniref:Uncharacterized protein n=1 Tax=Candidatus Sulfotelmatobacter kueseliae TaxID=2042962 RepID=A0A2U3L2J1_9BACT|nr:hypothetical protein SBA1_630036 [Candidatus Sulfotelmatobacter kueseliae]